MDLEWLLPEQIEQILKFCELSSVEDMAVAASILENHKWNIEDAMHDVIEQNDHITQKQMHKEMAQKLGQASFTQQQWQGEEDDEGEKFEIDEDHYSQLDSSSDANVSGKPKPPSSGNILKEQNQQYKQMQHLYYVQKAEEEERLKAEAEMENAYEQHRKESLQIDPTPHSPVEFKIRLPFSGAVRVKQFGALEKIDNIFKYVSGHFRDQFEHRHSQFDLTQAFPQLSLLEKRELMVGEVFPDSSGELLMIKEL